MKILEIEGYSTKVNNRDKLDRRLAAKLIKSKRVIRNWLVIKSEVVYVKCKVNCVKCVYIVY